MNRIYVMRHGDAVMRAPTDAERPLSERGRQDAAAMVQHLLECPPVKVVVSPYLRAQQTADIVLNGLKAAGHHPDIVTIEGITPDDDPFQAVKLIAGYDETPLLMVSHNPLVSVLVGLMSEGSAQASIGMETASIVCLTSEAPGLGTCQLEWYQSPL